MNLEGEDFKDGVRASRRSTQSYNPTEGTFDSSELSAKTVISASTWYRTEWESQKVLAGRGGGVYLT